MRVCSWLLKVKTISGFMREAELAINKIIFSVGFGKWKFESLALLLLLNKHRGLLSFQKLRGKFDFIFFYSSTNIFSGQPDKSLDEI